MAEVKFFLVKNQAGNEVGCQIEIGDLDFFIDYGQADYSGVRIGEYPRGGGCSLHPAVLIAE